MRLLLVLFALITGLSAPQLACADGAVGRAELAGAGVLAAGGAQAEAARPAAALRVARWPQPLQVAVPVRRIDKLAAIAAPSAPTVRIGDRARL